MESFNPEGARITLGFGDELSGVTFKWHSDSERSGRLQERQVEVEKAVDRPLSGCSGHSGGRDWGVNMVERWEATTALACPAGAVGTSLEPVLAMYQKPHWFCPNPRNFCLPNVRILLPEASAPKERRAPLLASHLSACLPGQSSTLRGVKTIPMENKCKKAKWLSEEALQISVNRREGKLSHV